MQAVILAGGFGTRLRSSVPDLPKCLAPVAGRPFVEYQLEGLAAAGYRRVVVATGYLAEAVRQRLGDRFADMQIEYSHEDSPLGTGGAIVRALDRLPDRPTLVMNGDTWLGLDLAAFRAWCEARPGSLGIVLRRVPDAARFGRVVLDGDRIEVFGGAGTSGPGLVNAGVYLLRRGVFDGHGLGEAFSIENDFFKPHARTLDLRGFVTEAYFIDIGIPADYERAQTELPAEFARR